MTSNSCPKAPRRRSVLAGGVRSRGKSELCSRRSEHPDDQRHVIADGDGVAIECETEPNRKSVLRVSRLEEQRDEKAHHLRLACVSRKRKKRSSGSTTPASV